MAFQKIKDFLTMPSDKFDEKYESAKIAKAQKKLDEIQQRQTGSNGRPATTSGSLSLTMTDPAPAALFGVAPAAVDPEVEKDITELNGWMTKLVLTNHEPVLVYIDKDGKIWPKDEFEAAQANSPFEIAATPAVRMAEKTSGADGKVKILSEPLPRGIEVRILKRLGLEVADSASASQTPAQPTTTPSGTTDTNPPTSTPAPTDPGAEEAPNFTAQAAKELGYADNVNLSTLSPKQLKALNECAEKLQREYEAKKAKEERCNAIKTALGTIAERVADWDDPKRQEQFLAIVEATSRQTDDDEDLAQLTDESKGLVKLLNPQTRNMIASAANNPALLGVLGMINLKDDPEEDDEPPDDSSKSRNRRRQQHNAENRRRKEETKTSDEEEQPEETGGQGTGEQPPAAK